MDALAWLDGVGRRPERPGPYSLELIGRLLDRLGRPQEAFRALHVAGTRGKGSTCALLSAALEEAGVPAGLTTSPHLIHVRERIRLRERDATDEALEEWLERVRKAAGELQPSYFEAVVAAAFLAFAESGVPLAVVEVGLGGRLDATVLCRPVVTAITRLGLEHRDRLGTTPWAIASEKAGILKPGVPAVLAPNGADAVRAVRTRASAVGAPLRLLGPADVESAPASGLPGPAQGQNAAVAWAVLEALSAAEDGRFRVSRDEAERGFARVRWPGRLDARRSADGVAVLVDVAHDVEGFETLVRHVRDVRLRPEAVVFSCLADKDLEALGARLADSEALGSPRVLVPVVDHPRARSADEVAAVLGAAGLPAEPRPDVPSALRDALAGGGPVLACGSFVVAGEVIRLLESGA